MANRSTSQVLIECHVRPPAVTKPRSRYAVRVRLLMYTKESGPRQFGVAGVRGVALPQVLFMTSAQQFSVCSPSDVM